MNKLTKSIKQFLNDEDGMGAVEYALIVAIMAAAIVTVWGVLEGGLTNAIDGVVGALGGGEGGE